jgi:hypothetical protein
MAQRMAACRIHGERGDRPCNLSLPEIGSSWRDMRHEGFKVPGVPPGTWMNRACSGGLQSFVFIPVTK